MAVIDDVAAYLQAQSLGTVGTNIFKSYIPEDIGDAVFVLDTGGMAPDEDIPLYEPTFQIFIRSATYSAGKTLLDSIKILLHRKANVALVTDSIYFYYIIAMQEGVHLGRDDNGVHEFSINFKTKIR